MEGIINSISRLLKYAKSQGRKRCLYVFLGEIYRHTFIIISGFNFFYG